MSHQSRPHAQMPPPLPHSPTRGQYHPGYDPRVSQNPAYHPDHQEPQAPPPGLTVEQLWAQLHGTNTPPPAGPGNSAQGRWPPMRSSRRILSSRSRSPRRRPQEAQYEGNTELPHDTQESRGRPRGRSRVRNTPPPPPPEEEDPEGDIEDEITDGVFADSKSLRFFHAFMRQLRVAKSDKWSIKDKSTPAGQLSKMARYMFRQWTPYGDGTEVMLNGMLWQGGAPPRWDVPEASLSIKQKEILKHQRECLQIFTWLQEKVSFFADIVPRLLGRGTDTLLIGSFIDTHARQARATDINTLKSLAPEIIKPVTLPCGKVIAPPLDMEQRKNKTFFGFYANWTALQLVPTNALDEFYEDPDAFRDLVIAGDYDVDHKDNPNFLYPTGEFDPYNLEKGLCQGEEHKNALRAIMTSPSSIYQPAGKKTLGRGCIAHVYKIRSVHPRNIAYAATLWRNVISSCAGWQEDDGEFNGPAFFKRICALFEGETAADEDWANETLAWWNSVVFGNATDTSSRKKGRRPGGTRSQEEILAQQRAARAAAAPAVSQAPAPPTGEDLIQEDPIQENPAQETPSGAN